MDLYNQTKRIHIPKMFDSDMEVEALEKKTRSGKKNAAKKASKVTNFLPFNTQY